MKQQERIFRKRRSELTNHLERLINLVVAGTLEEAVYRERRDATKEESAQLDRDAESRKENAENNEKLALEVYNLSQNMGGSGPVQRCPKNATCSKDSL